MGKKIKYLGSADIRTIPKGSDFGGQLSDATENDVVFNKENHWVIDTDEAGLSDEAVELLLEDKDTFKDVSDMKRIPTNLHQSTFLGMKSVSDAEENLVSTADSTTSGAATTTGGSTSGTGTDAGTTGGSSKRSGGKST